MVDGQITSEILEKAIAGDSSAFGVLYDTYQPRIYRFVYLKVSHREEAEDLTHQVFLNAWKHMGSFRNEGLPISGWLYQIARNRVIDYYRTRKQSINLDETIHEHEPELYVSGPMETLDIKLTMQEVRIAVRTLHPDQQDVIIMRFVEGLSPEETAVALGKNQGTIRVLQHRALTNLKKKLKKNHEDN
jgi:RNA polymerase sigma-70 factor (ECF subfamily)